MAKKNFDLNKQKDLKNELDEILNDMKAEGRIDDVKAFTALKDESVSKVISLDYYKIKKNAEKQANDHIDAIVAFYLPPDAIKDPFLVHKMNRDKFRLSKQIVQLEIAEHSIAKLNEEIDNGNYNPRLWEVMGTLMKSFDSMNITYAKMEILIENNYKTIQEELEYKKLTDENTVTIFEDKPKQLKPIGHKGLLQQIKSNLKATEEQVKFLNSNEESE